MIAAEAFRARSSLGGMIGGMTRSMPARPTMAGSERQNVSQPTAPPFDHVRSALLQDKAHVRSEVQPNVPLSFPKIISARSGFALAVWPVAATPRQCHISAMHQFGGIAHGQTHQFSYRVF
jgi:hypothetical protein